MATDATGNVLNVPGTSAKGPTVDDEILASYVGLYQKGLTMIQTASSAALAAPTIGTATAGAGGALPVGTYYYKVTALGYTGETTASAEVSAASASTNNTITVTWTAVTGATGYKIYRGTASGAEVYLTTVDGQATASYADAGAATLGTVPPPSANTTKRDVWLTGTVVKVSGTEKKYTAAAKADATADPATTSAIGFLRKDVDVSQSDKLANVVLGGVIKGAKIKFSDEAGNGSLTTAELHTLAKGLGGRYIAYNDTLVF